MFGFHLANPVSCSGMQIRRHTLEGGVHGIRDL